MPPVVYIALGSNLGNSVEILCQAAQRLERLSSSEVVTSSLWKSTPVDCPPDSPAFVNAVARMTPMRGETPETLLVKLKQLESDFGRQKKLVLNEPRPLDLDIIAFGDVVVNTESLTIPHPRAHLRRFVLEPLSEIAPNFTLPGGTATISTLLGRLNTSEILERMGSFSDRCRHQH